MDWTKHISAHSQEVFHKILVAVVVAGLFGFATWAYHMIMKTPVGWLDLTNLVLLLMGLVILTFLLRSHSQLAQDRRTQLADERHAVTLEQARADERHKKLNELLSGAIGQADLLGRAYILLKVKPNTSGPVACRESAVAAVQYAIAVWGQWDVIIRVDTTSSSKLIPFLTYLQNDPNIERTETLVVRSDQEETRGNAHEGGWAVLLARLGAAKTGEALKALKEASTGVDGIKIPDTGSIIKPSELRIQHAVGVLGQYDIALTVRYSNDTALANFVMGYMQRALKAETTTLPAIRGLVYRNGTALD